jgi:hypothetical protein
MLPLILFLASVLFFYLAWDAYRLGAPDPNVAYTVDGQAWDENLKVASVVERQDQKVWRRMHGPGRPIDAVWLWLILGAASSVAFVVAAFR